jgi:8-oxo-dGTP pyrophosphatase MutT (NUDIX family)
MGDVEYVNWAGRIRLEWMGRPQELPPVELITSVHSFCFLDGKLMLVDLNERGWDIPGGHREPDESAEECVLRETMEEGYVRGVPTLVGLVKVDHSENDQWRPGGKYPKVGYQAFYRVDITDVLPFGAEFEAARRIFVAPAEAPRLHPRWSRMLERALAAAVSSVR